MQISMFVPLLMLFLILGLQRKRMTLAARKLIKKRNLEDKTAMMELAKLFIGKECLLSMFNGHQYTGTVKEVTDGAVLIESNGTLEAINLEFVLRIREYPRNKNGKKKAIILE